MGSEGIADEVERLQSTWDITNYWAEQIATNDAPHSLLNLLAKQLAAVTNAERVVESARDELADRKDKLDEAQRTFDAIRHKVVGLVPELVTGYTSELKETVVLGPDGPVVVPVPEAQL